MLHFVTSYMKQNKIRKQTLESAQNGLKISFNTILDKKGGILTPRKSVVSIINSIQGDLDLIGIWRVKNPDTKSYT